MKQLKFMLAAATAVGLATAAQAAALNNTSLVNDTFDGATLPAGYSYNGAEGDNESKVEDGVLEVNTGTDPLFRALDFGESARDVNLADEKFDSLVIDTMVKFTVTPAGDEVKPSKNADGDILDKIMIYLAEVTNEVGFVTGTNLMVKAAKYTPRNPMVPGQLAKFEPVDTVINNVTVVPNAWYRLVVTSKKNQAGFAQFTIQLAAESQELVTLKNVDGLVNTDDTLFPSLTGINGVNPTALTYVGFAGEGKVDDLKVNLFELATSVDFTFTWSDSKISAVAYSIGEVTDQTVTKNETVTGLDAGNVITLTITPADWYKLASAETITYTVPNATPEDPVNLDDYVTEAAKVEEGNKITVSETTAPSDLGITSDSAFYAATASTEAAENLSKAMTWAMKFGGAKTAAEAADAVNALCFTAGVVETPAEQAYLLDCAINELGGEDGEIAKFKFAGFDLANGFTVGADSNKQAGDGGKYGNGFVEVRGSTTINGDYTEAADTDKHNFFKAFLVPFAPTK